MFLEPLTFKQTDTFPRYKGGESSYNFIWDCCDTANILFKTIGVIGSLLCALPFETSKKVIKHPRLVWVVTYVFITCTYILFYQLLTMKAVDISQRKQMVPSGQTPGDHNSQ